MHLDIQKANMWKRISAGLLDGILLSVLVAFLAMLMLGCAHIGEVQTSIWDNDTLRICKENHIRLL